MNNLDIKKEYKFCYSILENNKKTFFSKIAEVNKIKNCMIELRLDYLLAAGIEIEEIIDIIAQVKKKYTRKKLIATIRTISEGGRVDLTKEKYFYYIKMLYLKTRVHAIDVEYRFYKVDQKYYDSLFVKKKKDIILSMHFYNRVFFANDYTKMFKEMAESKADIIKFAIKTFTKEDLFTFMTTAKKANAMLKNAGKAAIFIAMGTIGKISRIIPEYTDTKIVFLSAYDDEDNNIGQFSLNTYNKYRNLLEKKLKT